jgi:hypothetical protein
MPTSDIDTNLVSNGAPVEGGCVLTSFAASPTAPTNATTDMSTLQDFVSLGELSDKGYTEGHETDTSDFKGWHGTTILSTVNSEKNTYKMELTEVERASVLQMRYGPENVTVDSETGLVTHIEGKPVGDVVVPLVIDELLADGRLRRTVAHKAKITKIDETPHQRGALLLYGIEFTLISTGAKEFDIYFATPSA